MEYRKFWILYTQEKNRENYIDGGGVGAASARSLRRFRLFYPAHTVEQYRSSSPSR